MYSNTLMFLTIISLVIFLSNAKNVFISNNSSELPTENTTALLNTTTDDMHSPDHRRRQSDVTCVPCVFGSYPCCEPRHCIKIDYWLNKCEEIIPHIHKAPQFF